MNQPIKKTAAVLLASSVLLGSFSGCASNPAPGDNGISLPANISYPVKPQELKSGTVKWTEEQTEDGWMKVINTNGDVSGPVLGYSPTSGVKLIQVDGYAFKDLNQNNQLDKYEDWRQDPLSRAADLASQMAPEEIAGLMVHYSQSNLTEEADEMDEPLAQGVRFVLSHATAYPVKVQATWANSMQSKAEGMGHGIPVNVSTNPRTTPIWPDNLGLAATFDPNIVFEATKGMSKEYRALGISTLLGPQIDLSADPRWARIGGTFGEDPALSRDMAAASVAGHQSTYAEDGTDLGWGVDSVNAMVKHWPGDGTGESGRESHDWYGQFAVYPGGQFETSLIPFVDGGFQSGSLTGSATGVMTSYSVAYSDNEEYGELVGSAFSEYKINLLRSFGFDGLICSDWGVTYDPAQDRYTVGWGLDGKTMAERDYLAIQAGVDQLGGQAKVEPVQEAYAQYVADYGEEAALARFQDSARRLLNTTFSVGLFENPYVSVSHALELVGGQEMKEAGYEAQLKSIVMLKNQDNTIQKASESAEKPTVYIPYVFSSEQTNVLGSVPSKAVLPVDLSVAREYFHVVTDTLREPLTGPVDPRSNQPTPTYQDIIRATPEELAECDYALVFVKSPENFRAGVTSAGYNLETETFIPISLQYGPYTADSENVRLESISGPMVEQEIANPYGVQQIKAKQNVSYYGKSAKLLNGTHLDSIQYAVENMPESAKIVVAIDAQNPVVVGEFEEQADAILMGFAMNEQTIFDIVSGKYEPSGLLPFQMPASMEAVEAQLEDVPRDMECYVDASGNRYDFGFGLNWSGQIQDARTQKYVVDPLVTPEAQPNAQS